MDLIKLNQLNKFNFYESRKMHRKVRKCKTIFNQPNLMMINSYFKLLLYILLLINYCKGDNLINQNSYYFEIEENTIDNQLIGQVNLIDGYQYRFGNLQPEFRLDSLTGKIYTTKFKLDREKKSFYNLIILNNSPSTNKPIEIKIKILDQNDNYPFFLNSLRRQITISESAPIGSKHILDTAIDLDFNDELNYELIYCLSKNDEQCKCDNLLKLNSTNDNVNNQNINSDHSVNIFKPFKLNFNKNNSILNLELNYNLDRESISNYNCKLCVFDLIKHSNSIDLNIEISDENDNSPIFLNKSYSIVLNHNLKKDSIILKVTAIDLDEPNTLNSKITYSLFNETNLINSNYDNLDDFYINKSTGSIHIRHDDGLPKFCANNLDNKSSINKCVFNVIASDNGNPRQQSKTQVTIYLSSTDNLHEPEIKILYFNQRFLQYAIVDKTSVFGTAVAAISVFDLDNEQNDQIKLEIITGNELDHFYLDSEFSSTGSYVIRVNQNFTNSILQNSSITNYNLTLKATDNGKPSLSSTQNLIIKINEISDDHKPVFNQQIYKVELSESSQIGSFICLVNAVDYNPQFIVYFYSLGGNNSDYFHIDSELGTVTLAKQLDRELINEFDLKVYVRDTHLNSEWSSARINVQVLDVNDCQPRVIRKSNLKYNYLDIIEKPDLTILKILEGNKVNYEFTVIDEDFGNNGSVNIELLYDYHGLFYLNTTSYLNRKDKIVHLHSTKELDFESIKNYDLLFILSDEGIPKLSSQFRIKIEVQDLDDQLTSIYPKHYFINLLNNQNENLIKIKTIDLDKTSMIKFNFNFNHNHKNLNFVNSLISIDEYTGNLQIKKSINTDQFPKYLPFNISCDICDRLNQQATIHLYLNMNDNSVLNNNNTTTIVISESSDLKSILNLKDELFNDLSDSYQLLIADGDPEQHFQIKNYQLNLIKKLDYEQKNQYNLTLCAFNSDHFKLLNLVIKVKNENNKQPEFDKPFVYLEIERNLPFHQNIYTLYAHDPDDLSSLELSTDHENEVSNLLSFNQINLNTVYHFTNPNQQQLSSSLSIQNGNHMFRINRDQLELNVNLLERKFINDELVYQYKNDLIYLVSIQCRDLNLKNDVQQFNRKMLINIFIKIKEPILDTAILFKQSLELMKSNYHLNVLESKPINSKLLKFDLIYNKNLDGQLIFEIINDDNNVKNYFALFPDGTLYLKNKLDREQNQDYILKISIKHKQTELKSDKLITVLVHVLDRNNCEPKWSQNDDYQFYINENSPINTTIGAVKSIDNDVGSNSVINYRILSKPNKYIALNSLTGQLYLKSPVDYEKIKQITIEIEAEDQATYEKRLKSKSKRVIVNIVNENDESPCFEIFDTDTNNYQCSNKLKQQISIMENLKPNTTIHEFKVKDQDTELNKLKFHLIDSEFSSNFHLNELTGKLKLIKNLDREINEKIDLLIKVDDGLHNAFCNLIIKLGNYNDNIPLWEKGQQLIYYVNENIEPGTILATLNATDYDISGVNSQINYEIVNVKSIRSPNSELCSNQPKFCEKDECFKIDKNQLILANYLDYENKKEYQINLTAVDSDGLRSEILPIKIKLIDLNDCSPKFLKREIKEEQQNSLEESVTIFENIKINTNIHLIQAFDCDENDELNYELVKCQIIGIYHKKCPLELNSKTGWLKTLDNLDYEEIKRINLKIKVTDRNQHTDLKDLNILIENLNDNKPRILTSTSFVILKQNEIERNEILAQLQAQDLDNDHVIYRIASELNDNQQQLDNQIFIDENDGFIRSKNRIDKRENLDLKFTVTLIDESGLFTNELISLAILFTNSSLDTIDLVFDVYENEPIGLIIHKFKCDTLTCKYYLNTCNKLFNIENGELKIESNLDRETKSIYYFDVVIVNQLSNIQVFKIKINILDKNDNSPIIIVGSNSLERIIHIKENERLNTIIFDLNTIVTDFDLNTKFQFNQLNCTASFNNAKKYLNQFNNPFVLESNTGKIILNRELDREREEKYELQFSISDGIFKINDSITIMIQVNDNIPKFEKSFYSFDILENTKNKSIIGSVVAKDLDLNSIIKYRIISEQKDSPFKINERTGSIYLIRSIDYETDNHLFISILQASDGEFQSKPITLYFNILNQNDCNPIFERTDYRFVFYDTEKVNSELFCLTAKDDDNDKLIYKMYENDEKEYQLFNDLLEEFYFEVDNDNGCIRLLKKFNIDYKSEFQFIVSVFDGLNYDYAKVQIRILKNETKIVKNFKKSLIIKLNSSNLKIGDVIYKFNNNENVKLINLISSSNNLISNLDELPFKINSFNELILSDNDLESNNFEFQLEFNQSLQNVTIEIKSNPIDLNIKFENEFYNRTIHEDHKIQNVILELNLLNFELKKIDTNLNLEIIDGNLNDQFLIYKNKLMLSKELDYEKIKQFNLKVKATLLNQINISTTANIQINILNVIDQKPIFLDKPYIFKWCENQIGELGRFFARSESNGLNNLRYLLKNNEYGDYFNLDTNTGVLNVIKEIDRESVKSPIIINVLVIDELNANLQNEIDASIEILNLNDNQPKFQKSKYEINLNEQMIYKKGFSIVELQASDLDNDPLRYELINCNLKLLSNNIDSLNKNQCSKMELNNSTGELYLNEETIFDRELEQEYHLKIQVNDGEFKSSATILIKIVDSNDQKPYLNHIQFKSNLVKKQIINDQIKFKIPYQYFTSDSYMTENDQLFLAGLNVLDDDEWNNLNSKINFKFIHQTDLRKLKLNKDNGVLFIQNTLASTYADKQQNRTIKLDIQFQDCALKNSLESKAKLDIEFYDLNNLKWMTIFEPILNELQVSENTTPESLICEFKLINSNLTTSSNKIDLNIVGGDYDNRFKIVNDQNKFKLILNRELDYEYVHNYLIYLEATVQNADQINNFQILELNLKLINENDNIPKFSKSIYNVTIYEEQEPNQFVIDLEVTDLDQQQQDSKNDLIISNLEDDDFNTNEFNLDKFNDRQLNEFRYEILSTNNSNKFRIDQSGIIYTTEKIDREEVGDNIELQVQVQDNGGLKSQTIVNVSIIDLNDNAPRFNQLFRVNVSENTLVGSFIIQITFNDRDKSKNNSHKFSLNDKRFTIDQIGRVYLASKLDSDQGEDEIQVMVTIYDGEWSQHTTLTIYVIDENDETPQFQGCKVDFRSKNECIYHFEFDKLNESIGTVKSVDNDKGLNALINYQLMEESNLFSIDRQSGELFRLKNNLQDELYELKVKACDHGIIRKCSDAKIYLTKSQDKMNNQINLPIPIDLADNTIIYKKQDDLNDDNGFGYCKSINSNDSDILTFYNHSLVFKGENKIKLGQQISCLFWSIFELQKFTNLKIVVTKRNYFEPQFLTTRNQLILNETITNEHQIFQFKSIDNDSNDGFNNEISYKMNLIDVEFNPNALQYYFYQFKTTNLEDKHFFAKSIKWSLQNNNLTRKYLNPFTINPKTGSLNLDFKLDYELIKSYKYQVTISDNAIFYQKSSSQFIDIIVNNLDDNQLLFLNDNELTSELNLTIKEGDKTGEILKNINVIDFDDPNYSIKNLKFKDSNFELDDLGNLKSLTSFSYNTKSNYIINLKDNLKININILNVNKSRPKFTQKMFEFNLLEQTKLGSIIANLNHTINSTNLELYEFVLIKPINFGITLTNDNNLIVNNEIDFESFSMNEIYKKTQNDNIPISEIKLKFSLLVKLKNELVYSPENYDRTELIINLIDLNEPPKFERSSIDCLFIRTNGKCNYQFVNECQVKAVDQDQDEFIRYRLLNHNHLFSIDDKGFVNLISCNLTTNLNLNLPSDSVLDVVAIDSNDLQSKIKVNIKMNWRNRVETLFNHHNLPSSLNDHLYIQSNQTIDKELIDEWCSKGKQVPESTERMVCYRKTIDHYCCKCKLNYQGLNNCGNENLCSLDENYCQNGGLCKQINVNERICMCRAGFRGLRCEQSSSACNDKSLQACGVNGKCEVLKEFNTHKCTCLDNHTFGRDCQTYSFGLKRMAYIRLNVSLNEMNNELSMTFASYYRVNSKNQNDDFGQLLFFNHGNLNQQTGKQDFMALELYEKYILLRIGGIQLSKIIELKLNSNNQDLLDGRYYKFSLIRNRRISHLSLYQCERMYLDNQLNCNQILNQSSISYQQSNFNFNSNPLFIGGLDYAYSNRNIYQQKTNGNVQAKSNFIGCLYKATMNGVKINEFIAEKAAVDPICRVSMISNQQQTEINDNNLLVSSLNHVNQQPNQLSNSKKEDCNSYCGKESIYCKQNWFENRCGCRIQINNQTSLNHDQQLINKQQTLFYESSLPCNNLCEVQMNKMSKIKLKLSDKWNSLIQTSYQTKLEEFVLRFYLTAFTASADTLSNLWTNNQLSIRLSSNGTLYMFIEDNYEPQIIKLNGKLKLNQWNIYTLKANGDQFVNEQFNEVNSKLFKSNLLKPIIIGDGLSGCISHIIINGHLLLNNNDHLYELHTENVLNGFGCKGLFESSKLNLDTISISIILIIMFFIILLLVISTSFMLFNSKRKTPKNQTRSRSTTLPKISHHTSSSLAQMIGNNSYTTHDYYEEPFYYGDSYFQHNEKLASNQFNFNRSNF